MIVIAQLLLGITSNAQLSTIFNFGAQWRYLDNGTNLGTTWKEVGFNDASWSADTGTFGYGDSWVTKCVNACGTVSCNPSCTNKYITTYFRKTVNIATASFDSVQISVMRDDGFVLYINGVEVWRDNMPTGTITSSTLAPAAIGGSDENTPITRNFPISAFTDGNNIIALELHQNAGTSSDMTYNMQMRGFVKTTIFSFGSQWKYLATPTDQGTTWRQSSFNDASWSVGTGHIGYGESWTTTCIPAGASCAASCMPGSCTKYNTTYFRKTISIPNPALYDSIRFSVYRDDGLVMYVNGVEVWRNNLPTGTISYSTLAPNNVNGTTGSWAESTAVVQSIPISAFTAGNNVIAVELHQNSATSSDLDFNVQAVGVQYIPPTPVNIVFGPYLQMGNQNAATIRWRTNIAARSLIALGTTYGSYPIVVNSAAFNTNHELRATGLIPNTKYYYRFGTDTSWLQGDTANFFVTAPAFGTSRRVTIAAFGDCGRNDNGNQNGSLAAYRNYLSSIGMQASDLMLLLGDNAYNNGTDAEFSNLFFAPYSSTILKNHMLFPAPGNHDYAQSSARQIDKNVPYFSLFTMPTAAECGGVASGTKAYYSFDWGDVHFLSLDSYGREDAGTTKMYDTTGAQVNWIKADLAANTKKWVIAYWHHPPFTMGSHNSDNESDLAAIRQNFIRILERYGVDLIMCGHSHDYERSYLLKNYYGNEASFNKAAHTADSSSAKYDGSTNSCPYVTESGKVNHGTVYVVSGSAGASGGVQSGYPHNALPFALNDGGMFFIDINENRLDAKFIRKNNTIYDQFTIVKDAKVVDTIDVLHGNSVSLTASWPGNYSWAPGVNARSISFTATADTLVEVKDNPTTACLVDKHYVNVQCTMPGFTSAPSAIVQDGCRPVVSYTFADTGRPRPVISYSFSGATSGAGLGSGSGATFGIGVTTVTLTSTNDCGAASTSFTVTIQQLPVQYSVAGGGNYCAGGSGVNVGLTGSQSGVNYQLYNGASAVGSAVAGTGAAISFGLHTSAGTYTVLATDATTGCTQPMLGSANVLIDPLPTAQLLTGGGSYCSGGTGLSIGLVSSVSGVDYALYRSGSYTGTTMSGTSAALSFGTYTASGTYSVIATNATTGCVATFPDVKVISINPLPATFTITGGGSYCAGGTGVAIGLNSSASGISYQLFNGSTASGVAIPGTGSSLAFGSRTEAGTYSAVATNTVTGCVRNMSGSASVVINPLVTPAVSVNPLPVSGVCAGAMVTFSASAENAGTAPTYVWYVNATPVAVMPTYSYYPAHNDSVSVKMITSIACPAITAVEASEIVNVVPTVVPTASINVTPASILCDGATVSAIATVTNGGSAPLYAWYRNGVDVASTTGFTFTPANGDVLSLELTSNALCRTSDVVVSNEISFEVDSRNTPLISISALPGLYIATGQEVKLSAAVANAGALPRYQWVINDSVIAGATTAVFNYASYFNGDSVTCVVISDDACAVMAHNSVKVMVTPLAVGNVAGVGSVVIIPNPNTGSFVVKGDLQIVDNTVELSVANMLGQLVYKQSAHLSSGALDVQVALSNDLPSGLYLLTISTQSGNLSYPVMLKK